MWNGVYIEISIKFVMNNIEFLFGVFLVFIVNEIWCLYGKKFGNCNDMEKIELECKLCLMMDVVGYECYLWNFDMYIFEVIVVMDVGYVWVKFDVGYSFLNMLMVLWEGDRVEFIGILVKDLGMK